MRRLISAAALILVLTGCQISLFNRPVAKEAYLRQLSHAGETNPHAEFLSGKRSLEQGKGKRAERSFKQALKAEPDRPEFHIGLGLAYEDQREWRAAKKAYQKALTLNPNSPQAELKLGRLAWRTGNSEEASYWAKKAAQHDDSADLWKLKGEIAYITLDYPEAISNWTQSLNRQPDQPILRELLNDLSGYLAQEKK